MWYNGPFNVLCKKTKGLSMPKTKGFISSMPKTKGFILGIAKNKRFLWKTKAAEAGIKKRKQNKNKRFECHPNNLN